MVGHVTGREHARHAGRRGVAVGAAADVDVAPVHLELAVEDARVGRVADRDEHAGQFHVRGLPGLDALHAHSGHPGIVAQHFLEHVVPHDGDLAGGLAVENALLQNLLGAQFVAAVHQDDLVGNIRQVQGLLDGRVAAADHGHFAAPVEEAVAGRTGRNTAALVGLLGGQAQVLGAGAGRDHDGIGRVHARIAFQAKRALAEVGRVDVVEHDFRVEALGVLQHVLHQFRALELGVAARPVLDLGGRGQLAALFHARYDHGAKVGAGAVDRRGIARGARSHDQQPAVLGFAHVIIAPVI